MLSLVILVVDSRNRVSFGCILWNTTRCIDDLPLLQSVSVLISCSVPSVAEKQKAWFGAIFED